jgi:hypothetical protein
MEMVGKCVAGLALGTRVLDSLGERGKRGVVWGSGVMPIIWGNTELLGEFPLVG